MSDAPGGLPDPIEGLLADPALWEEAGPEVRASVLAAASGREAPEAATVVLIGARRRRTALGLLAAAAAVAVVVAAPPLARRSEPTGPTAELALTGSTGPVQATVSIEEQASGWSLELDGSDLPALPPGSYYEAFVSADPSGPISTGTFRAGGTVTLWTGLEKVGGRRLTVMVVDPAPPGRSLGPVAEGTIPVPS